MGSATRQALHATRAALNASTDVDLAGAESIFAAARVIGHTPQLQSALTDPGAQPEAKRALVKAVFGAEVTPAALALLDVVAAQRWSSSVDVLEGIEDLGLRMATRAASGASIDDELFAFGRTVSSNAELELALTSKLGSLESKVALLDTLLKGKAAPATIAILSHIVQQPRGRRIGELLRNAAVVVADEAGYSVAVVTSAAPIAPAQLERLASGLAEKYGRKLRINLVVDPTILGGLRVQVGDDVIDGSIAKRLGDLRLQLAG